MKEGVYHFKTMVPSVAAGAIIGKAGETIAQLQKEAGARVKMSKANDFYPGTTERVCLITGSIEAIIKVQSFIMDRIREKPDPTAKPAIDFDSKQTAEREKQVKILVPNSTAGMIIGRGGNYIKQIKEESGSYVQISQKAKDHALQERCITVIGDMDCNLKACGMILAKVLEDPQSGSCLNVSYQDVQGPVANFNPTGSPYAQTANGSPTNGNNTSNGSYSPNGSMNSLSSPTPLGGGLSVSLNPPLNTAQLIENIRSSLRASGYSEQAINEISSAMNTLANYGILGLGLGLGATPNGGVATLTNGSNGYGQLSVNIATTHGGGIPQMNTPPADGIGMYSVNNGTPMDTNQLAATLANGIPLGSMFGPIGSSNNIGLASPVGRGGKPLRYGDVFDPFLQQSPALASPVTPINNNSFGLGTSPLAAYRKTMSPTEEGAQKLDVEIGENIVGAILGPGGKSLVEIQHFSGANVQISKKGIFAPGTRNRIVSISGSPGAITTARYLIEQRICEEESKRARNNVTLMR